jgi:hypothetical protein
MDAKIERRLTDKERETIEHIKEKAAKRKHKPKYHVDFIVSYMLESFKDWDYDEKQDALDMLNAIFEIAKKCKVMTDKAIKKERAYMMKEYVNEWWDDE